MNCLGARCGRYLQQNIIYFVFSSDFISGCVYTHERNTTVIYEAVRRTRRTGRDATQRNSVCASVCAETLITIYERHVLLSRTSPGELASLRKIRAAIERLYDALSLRRDVTHREKLRDVEGNAVVFFFFFFLNTTLWL